jgi:hypothetical protein
MKRTLSAAGTILLSLAFLFANPVSVLASEGEHALEKEVNGYHVTLSSQNEWTKGENTVVVTLKDSMGMPVQNADVEIQIASSESEPESADSHQTQTSHTSMPGMDMGEPEPQASASEMTDRAEEANAPMAMTESEERGVYVLETHLESVGEQNVIVFFHVNGEMLQADFLVDVAGVASKSVVLWSFVAVNTSVLVSAGVLKRQSNSVKGK